MMQSLTLACYTHETCIQKQQLRAWGLKLETERGCAPRRENNLILKMYNEKRNVENVLIIEPTTGLLKQELSTTLILCVIFNNSLSLTSKMQTVQTPSISMAHNDMCTRGQCPFGFLSCALIHNTVYIARTSMLQLHPVRSWASSVRFKPEGKNWEAESVCSNVTGAVERASSQSDQPRHWWLPSTWPSESSS